MAMELERRMISEKRCKEISGWKIHDPYPHGSPNPGRIFTAERHYFVTNKDESILFCHAFSPRHEVYNEYDPIYLLIENNDYHFGRGIFRRKWKKERITRTIKMLNIQL